MVTISSFDKDDLNLDLEIREILITLNANGFITCGSCAGHQDCPPGHGDHGFISFEGVYSHVAIIAALEWYGLKNITVANHHNYDDGSDWIAACFDPVGKRISPWWLRHRRLIERRGKSRAKQVAVATRV